MKRKIILFIATSLDGYIAMENGDINWLNTVKGEGDNGFTEFYKTIDTIVMGKTTYDHVLTLAEEFPHSDRKCYVFSTSSTGNDKYVEFVLGDVVMFTNNLQHQVGGDIWLVGGSGLLDQFIKEDLVDEYIITVAPMILGKGIPLFETDNPRLRLSLRESKQFGEFVQLHYLRK
ncbi:MAG TPA: dihydrofolate reductase [Desulfosporosinus sp.]|nr:dihydrofolate reductase [Desulfosporosinus sp.]